MNKVDLMKKLAASATRLDYNGFRKEAKKIDTILVKISETDFDPRDIDRENQFEGDYDSFDDYSPKARMIDTMIDRLVSDGHLEDADNYFDYDDQDIIDLYNEKYRKNEMVDYQQEDFGWAGDRE